MSFIDARVLEDGTTLDTEVCIAGAGAAGITLAERLAPHVRDICLVESGGFTPDAATQALHDIDSLGHPVRENYMSRARYFGGTCNLWAGRNMALGELDFAARSWVPDSGWPISHADVAAFYPEAEGILGLPGLETVGPGFMSRRMSAAERDLFAGEEFVPTVSMWARSARRFGGERSPLGRAQRVRVLLHASATRLNTHPSGRTVQSLSLATLDGRRITVRARVFVLACGGLENARLLLLSNDRHPHGIGNEYDVVGRYFMDHPRAVFGRVHLQPHATLSLLRGRPLRDGKLQLGVGLSPQRQREEQMLNHYVTFESQSSGYTEARYQSFVQTMKVALRRGYAGSRWDLARANATRIPEMIYLLSPKELMPHPLYRLYVLARDALPRRTKPQTFVAVYFCEQPPERDSRVTLGTSRDALGLNRLELHWRIGEQVRRDVVRMQQLLHLRLEEAGLGHLEPSQEEPVFTDASHHMGTTRMSDSPRHGVVDRNCRVHGTDNLFLAGSSVFPAAGHANPTLTIVALALRLAERLREART